MTRPRILVVGPRQSGKRALIHALSTLDAAACGALGVESSLRVSGLADGNASCDWDFVTKYYTAPVALNLLPSAAWDAPPPAAALAGTEALIAVLDATAALSDHAALLQRWGDVAAELGVETLLCVVNKAEISMGRVPGSADGAGDSLTADDAGGDAVPGLVDLRAFCLERGFELLPASAHHPLVGASRREKEGLPRVYEALQNTLWSNMVRTPQAAAARPAATSDAVTVTARPPSESTLPAPVTEPLASSGISSAVALGSAADEGGDGGELDADADDVGLERLMRDMMRVRAAAATGALSDEARRAAASRMVEQMMALMGADDEEGEDGDADTDDSDQPNGEASS